MWYILLYSPLFNDRYKHLATNISCLPLVGAYSGFEVLERCGPKAHFFFHKKRSGETVDGSEIPRPNTWDVYQNLEFLMGQTTHRNWWLPDFWTINSSSQLPVLAPWQREARPKDSAQHARGCRKEYTNRPQRKILGRGDFWMFWSNCSLTKQTCRRWRSFFFWGGGALQKTETNRSCSTKKWLSIEGRSRNLNTSWHKVKKKCAEFIHIPKKHVGDHGEIRQKQWHPWKSSAFKVFPNSLHHAKQFVKQRFPFTKWRQTCTRWVTGWWVAMRLLEIPGTKIPIWICLNGCINFWGRFYWKTWWTWEISCPFKGQKRLAD